MSKEEFFSKLPRQTYCFVVFPYPSKTSYAKLGIQLRRRGISLQIIIIIMIIIMTIIIIIKKKKKNSNNSDNNNNNNNNNNSSNNKELNGPSFIEFSENP